MATCAGVDVDPDSPLLLGALGDEGLDARLAVWDDPAEAWDRDDLVLVRSTWDYAPRHAEFLAWAASVPRLANPYPVIAYSSDKHYLVDLAARGHRVVPTTVLEVGDEAQLPAGDVVVKPCVGAGSMDAARYRPGEGDAARVHVARLHAASRAALVQPYVNSVDEVGERALVFIGGEFSHAMTKGAMLNVQEYDRTALFRRERMSLAPVEADALATARALLADLGWSDLLYARVDLVRLDGAWALMELELVEPSLFLSHFAPAARALADAIARRLGGAG